MRILPRNGLEVFLVARITVRDSDSGWQPDFRTGMLDAIAKASSQLGIHYHEVSAIQGLDRESLVQTKAQRRTEAATASVVPAIVSMTFNPHPIQCDVASVHERTYLILLIDIDKDIPACPAHRIRIFMDRSYCPVLRPYCSSGVVPVAEGET